MHDPLARRHQGGAVYNKIVSNEDETLTFLMGCGKYERQGISAERQGLRKDLQVHVDGHHLIRRSSRSGRVSATQTPPAAVSLIERLEKHAADYQCAEIPARSGVHVPRGC